MSLSMDLARQIADRSISGKIIVAAKHPQTTYSAVKKQWQKLIRELEKERAAVLGSTKIAKFLDETNRMKHLTFSYTLSNFDPDADVTFATADELVAMPPVCQTLYVTYEFERTKLHLLTGWMPLRSLVVIYEND
jgi:hypothetical protein